MKILKFYENNDNDGISNDHISEAFFDIIDDEGVSLTIKDILITNENRAIKVTPYIKDINKVTKGKLVELTLKDKAKGINISSVSGGLSSCLTNFDILEDIIHRIKRFYQHTGEEVNYQIVNNFKGLQIMFVTKGGRLKDEDSFVEEIDELLSELKNIYKEKFKYHRVTIKNNSLEIRLPRSSREEPGWTMRKVMSGDYDHEHNRQSLQSLVQWRDKMREKGFDIEYGGGDNQTIFRLKR